MVPLSLGIPYRFENDHRPCGTDNDNDNDNDHEWECPREDPRASFFMGLLPEPVYPARSRPWDRFG